MKKFYLLEKDRNEEEKKTNKASYMTLVDRFFPNRVRCNNIAHIDYELEDIIGKQYDEEKQEYLEIFQYFFTDINKWDLESLKKLLADNNDDSILLLYSNVLDVYILAVTHCGTHWDYVQTNIALTDDINESF